MENNMSNTGNINLTLLKKFVSELENSLSAAEAVRASPSGDSQDYLVEMAKASGLAVSASQEATMLLGDIHAKMMQIQSPSASKNSLLEKLFGGPPGGATGGGPLGGGFGGGFGGGLGGSEN
jgi:hypothetical protein